MIAGDQVGDTMFVTVTADSWTEAPFFAVRVENRPTGAQHPFAPHPGHPLTDGVVDDLTALAPQSGALFVRTPHRNSTP
jgi:hypothetical protein